MDRMEDKLDQLSVLLELRLCVKKKKSYNRETSDNKEGKFRPLSEL